MYEAVPDTCIEPALRETWCDRKVGQKNDWSQVCGHLLLSVQHYQDQHQVCGVCPPDNF